MKITLVKKHQEAPTTQSFVFKPDEPFQFQAGQFIRLTVPHENPDNRGVTRNFSIASSPTEEHIIIATRLIEGGSTFKRALFAKEIGSQFELIGPFGRFILPEDEKNCMFITGGVGITPVRSILKFATDKKLPNHLVLLFSNRTAEEILFKNFLNELTTHNPKLEVVHTITKPEETKVRWTGRVGRIDKELVWEKIKDPKNTMFYVSGPITLVETFTTLLREINIPDDRIKRENFPGY